MKRTRTEMLRLFLALTLLTSALAQDAASLAQQAFALQQQGNYEQAATVYANLVGLVPKDVATRVNYGVVLAHLNRYREAIVQYEAAEKLLPGDRRISLNLALAYARSGDRKEARKRFESLHAAEPGNSQVSMLLADSCLQTQEYACVLSVLDPLKGSDDPGIAYMLATALLRTRHFTEAQTYVDRVAASGDTPQVRYVLGIQAYESGNLPDAVKQLQIAAEKEPSLPGLQSMLGRSLLYTGDADAALKALNLAIEQNPDDLAALLPKADILAERKQDQQARSLAQHVLQLDPGNPQAEVTLSEVEWRTGSLSEARRYAEKAAAVLPQDEHAHRILASIYRALRENSKAAGQDELADRLAASADPGPRANELAPDFTLAEAGTGKRVHLADYRGKAPVTVIFGSYTCPNFRDSASALKDLQKRYGSRVPFLLVYVREAHAEGQWQSTRNGENPLSLAQAATITEKEEHATMCSRALHLPFPALVDGMDGAVEAAYNAWPSRAYVIGKNGRIVYVTRLTEFEFQPDRMEAVLRKLFNE